MSQRATAIRRQAVDSTEETAYRPPIWCNKIVIQNTAGSDLYMRTISGDTNNQIVVPNGDQFELPGLLSHPVQGRFVFNPNITEFYMQLASSSGYVKVLCIGNPAP